ncbi:hypothetical protein F9006_22135, partial [Escherichia coli]
MGSCAAPSAKGDDKFITTDYLQQCQLVSEEAEQHRDNIRQLRAVVKKRAYCFYVWLSWFRVICPPGLRKVIHRLCAFKKLIFSS